jgi:hypothetical protein
MIILIVSKQLVQAPQVMPYVYQTIEKRGIDAAAGAL